MSGRPCQDPIGDAGRRAALAGLPVSACPYPAETGFWARWCAAWHDAKTAHGPAIAEAMRRAVVGMESERPRERRDYTPIETQRFEAMLAAGKDAEEIAAALGRTVRGVKVKIALVGAGGTWTGQQDEDLRRLVQRSVDGVEVLTAAMIGVRLNRSQHAVSGRMCKLGLRFGRYGVPKKLAAE